MTLAAQQEAGFFHETVVDLHGAVIPGARVKISAREGECETSSDVVGKFNCQLPPGTLLCSRDFCVLLSCIDEPQSPSKPRLTFI